MRRLTSIFLALLLAGLLCTGALAAGSAEIVRAFVYDGTLYTYVSMDGVEQPVTKAEARVGGQTFSAAGRLETVRQAGAPVTWLLLGDNAASMPAVRLNPSLCHHRIYQHILFPVKPGFPPFHVSGCRHGFLPLFAAPMKYQKQKHPCQSHRKR